MSEHLPPEIVTLSPQPVAVLRETVRMDVLSDFFDRAFHAAARTASAQGVIIVGPPVGIYFGMPSETVDVGAGFPTDRPVSPDAGVSAETLPGGRAAQIVHQGSYDSMRQTYDRLLAWLSQQGLTPGPVMWESYLTEPNPAHPEETQTLIVWPLV